MIVLVGRVYLDGLQNLQLGKLIVLLNVQADSQVVVSLVVMVI